MTVICISVIQIIIQLRSNYEEYKLAKVNKFEQVCLNKEVGEEKGTEFKVWIKG